MELDDKTLMVQAGQGNESAFETLVTRYQRTVYFAAYRLIHNHADADDILQETFIRLFMTLQKGTNIENLVAWLYRISINLTIDKFRKATRLKTADLETRTEEAETLHIELPDTKSVSPHEESAAQERRSIIRQAIDTLPLQQKTVIILHYLEELKVKEIAAILDLAEGTVKSTLYQAHRKLRQKLLPLMVELRGEAAAQVDNVKELKYTTETERIEVHQQTKLK